MKKIGIVYFSGTGNTEFLAKSIKGSLVEKNFLVDLINIEKDDMDCNDYEYLIIGGPVYVERYPEILIRYIEKKAKGFKGKCMLFSTQAHNKATTTFQHFINRVDCLNVTYCEFFEMINNFSNFMFAQASKEEQEKAVKDSMVKSKEAVSNFLEGKTNFYPVKKSKVIAIDVIYKMFYPHLAKFMTRKIEVNKNKCIMCNLCEESCPVKALKMGEKVKINRKCLLCQRCMNNCPKGAFVYKDKEYEQFRIFKKQ